MSHGYPGYINISTYVRMCVRMFVCPYIMFVCPYVCLSVYIHGGDAGPAAKVFSCTSPILPSIWTVLISDEAEGLGSPLTSYQERTVGTRLWAIVVAVKLDTFSVYWTSYILDLLANTCYLRAVSELSDNSLLVRRH